MAKTNIQELLKNADVIEEIKKHLWIESEKAGYDIGFDRASEDWINKFSKDWMKLHRSASKAGTGASKAKAAAKPKKRRAKSYAR